MPEAPGDGTLGALGNFLGVWVEAHPHVATHQQLRGCRRG